MTGRATRSRAVRTTSGGKAKPAASDSPKLSAAFTQRKLTDFRSSGSKDKDKVQAPGPGKRQRETVEKDETEEVKLVEASSEEEDSVEVGAKRLKAVHEIRLDEKAEATTAAVPARIRELMNDRVTVLATLKAFDLDTRFGPCLGLSRLERWNRAEKLDLQPPDDIRQILLTSETQKDDELSEALWHKDL